MSFIPVLDATALALFFGLWIGYHFFSLYWSAHYPSLLRETNRFRRQWIYRVTEHDLRVADATLINGLTSSSTFFASTTIIIIGGLFALLRTSERVVEVVSELPFSHKTSGLLWDIKIVVLIAVFVYAFFRFTWSLRQYNFCAILIGAAPKPDDFLVEGGDDARMEYVRRTGGLIGYAAESYNDGLRAYYFAIAGCGWFVSPIALMLTTSFVVGILFFREFKSKTLQIMTE